MPDPGRPTSTHAARRIDPTALQGDWINTESSPRGLARILIERRSDAIAMRALGVEGRTPEGMEWFESRALYASSSTGGDAVAFIAERDADSMPVALHANVSKGLLIVSSFQTRLLSDGPERRFAREFFRRADPESPAPSDVSPKESAVRPLFFENRIFHTAAPNLSNRTSKVLMYGYAYRWMKQEVYLENPDPGMLAKADPIMRQLLGGYRDVDTPPWALERWADRPAVPSVKVSWTVEV
jgi:hypothetical protein